MGNRTGSGCLDGFIVVWSLEGATAYAPRWDWGPYVTRRGSYAVLDLVGIRRRTFVRSGFERNAERQLPCQLGVFPVVRPRTRNIVRHFCDPHIGYTCRLYAPMGDLWLHCLKRCRILVIVACIWQSQSYSMFKSNHVWTATNLTLYAVIKLNKYSYMPSSGFCLCLFFLKKL